VRRRVGEARGGKKGVVERGGATSKFVAKRKKEVGGQKEFTYDDFTPQCGKKKPITKQTSLIGPHRCQEGQTSRTKKENDPPSLHSQAWRGAEKGGEKDGWLEPNQKG